MKIDANALKLHEGDEVDLGDYRAVDNGDDANTTGNPAKVAEVAK
jgi:hypothetical protein